MTVTAKQTTDSYDVEDLASWQYAEPPIKVTDMPRASIDVPLHNGANSHRLAAGKKVTLRRNGKKEFPGLVVQSTPQGGRSPRVEARLMHEGYHNLRRWQADDYDFDEDGDPSTTRDGVTVNPWNYFIYREPASTLDIYGNGYPVHGINVTDAVRAMCGTRFVYQHDFQDNSHLLASDIYATTNTLQVYRDGATGDLRPVLQRVREDADGFEAASAIESIPLMNGDPYIRAMGTVSNVAVTLIGEAALSGGSESGGAAGTDSSGNSLTLTENGTPADRNSTQAKYGVGYDLDGTDDALTSTSASFDITGDLSVFMSAEFDDDPAVTNEVLFGSVNAALDGESAYFLLQRLTSNVLRYIHYDGTSAVIKSSAATVSSGHHNITLRRDDTAKTIVVKVDGTEFINTTYTGSVAPTVAADFWIGGTNMSHMDGGVYEVRVWDSAVSQTILDSIADPDDNTYKFVAEGNELALYFLAATVTAPTRDDPTIDLCRDAGDASGSSLVNNASRTYTSVTLTHAANYNGSGLSAWTGTVDLSGDGASVTNMLGYRINIGGSDGSADSTKIHYMALVATTTSDVDLTEGTAESYSNGSTITGLRGGAVGNERDWIEGDFLGMRRHEAIERIRSATESDAAANSSPHWDFHIDADLAYHWQERRGTDKTREYSVAAENLIDRPTHEFWGEEVAYQTIAYGAGSGIARTRIVSKTAFSSGGLYDSDRDPTTGSATEVELANLARVMEFVDQDERSIVTLLRKARASHKLHRELIEKFSVNVLAEHVPFFETGDGILLRDIPTRTNGTVRVVSVQRSGGGDQRERLKVTLGEPSLDIGGFTRGSLQAEETFTVRAPPGSASTGLAGTGWFFDKDHFGPVPFNVPPGVERCSLRITTLPWQANAKATTAAFDNSELILSDTQSTGSLSAGGSTSLTYNFTEEFTIAEDTSIAYRVGVDLTSTSAAFSTLVDVNLDDSVSGNGVVYVRSHTMDDDGGSNIPTLHDTVTSREITNLVPSLTRLDSLTVFIDNTSAGARTFDIKVDVVKVNKSTLDFGIYQFDGDSGDGTGAAVFCENATFAVDPADADGDGIPTTAEFNAKQHPTPIGKSTQSRTIDVDVTGYLDADASGAIEPGVHTVYFRGTTASGNTDGLGVVSVTPTFTMRQGANS